MHFFSHKSRKRIRTIGIAIIIYALVLGVLTILFPFHGVSYFETFRKWFIAVPVFLVISFGSEWVGTKVFSLSFWQEMPSIARISLLVFCLISVVVAAIYFREFGL